jgi:hypothetical protein
MGKEKNKEKHCVRCGGPFKASVMGSPVVYTAVLIKEGLVHWSPIACLEFKKRKGS